MSRSRSLGLCPLMVLPTTGLLEPGGGVKLWVFTEAQFVKFYWRLRTMTLNCSWSWTDLFGTTYNFSVSCELERVVQDEKLLNFRGVSGVDDFSGYWEFTGSGIQDNGVLAASVAISIKFAASAHGDLPWISWDKERGLVSVPFYVLGTLEYSGPKGGASGFSNYIEDIGTEGDSSEKRVFYNPSGNPTPFSFTTYLFQNAPPPPNNPEFADLQMTLSFKDGFQYADTEGFMWNVPYEDDTKNRNTTAQPL